MPEYAKYTVEMKDTHTILIPNMLPIHFHLLISVFETYGYHAKLLESESRTVINEGLKNVHNDTCYPALLVIGQFMEALKSGQYNPKRTALMLTQTGGGCRASNYIHLLRKCLQETFPEVPVISFNFSGLEKGGGFQITTGMTIKLLYSVMYGDLLMMVYNQCRAYELIRGSSEKLLRKWEQRLDTAFKKNKYTNTRKIYRAILEDFAKIERSTVPKIKVGIVGEIYVKYSPLANNHLEDFLISEGCEPVVPTLLEFILYWSLNKLTEAKIYDTRKASTSIYGLVYKFLYHEQKVVIEEMKNHGVFTAPHPFKRIKEVGEQYINLGICMGEGWLIPAEMGVLAESGTENIICTQPFGCLPNHIVGKGMTRIIKENFPGANIIAVDYDPGATRVNQENRIKLMLANARCVV